VSRSVLVGEGVAARPLDQHRHEGTHRSALEPGVLAEDGVLDVVGGKLPKLLCRPGSDVAHGISL
jgi:hypothetical protein